MTSEYDRYIRIEWELFVRDAQRGRESLEAVSDIQLERVLDVGCGAGQELLPFATSSFCVGVDLSTEAGFIGSELFRALGLSSQVAFARAIAEDLPFRAASFDLVICRLALPYTHNARALSEMSRVLAPKGIVLLKIHHARFYWQKFLSGISSRDILSMVHAVRVLAAGFVYHLSGRQMTTHLLSAETFQTEWRLRRELKRCGLEIRQKMPSSNPATPFFLISRCSVIDG